MVTRSQLKNFFLNFQVVGSNFVKFMSILKRQATSSSIFVSFFIVMTHNSIVNLKLIYFLLWTKGSYQSSNFDTFEFSGENLLNFSCHFPSNKSVFLQILHHSSMSWKTTPLYFFTLCQFWNDELIPVQILSLSSVSRKITPLYFFSSNDIYFAQKEPIKMKIFETFECSGHNLSNSFCQFLNDKSIPLQILHP